MKRPYRYKSPNCEKRHENQIVNRGIDYFRIHLRIRAALKAFGPMITEDIIRWVGTEFAEVAVRLEIKRMEDAGETWRPIQTQCWTLLR